MTSGRASLLLLLMAALVITGTLGACPLLNGNGTGEQAHSCCPKSKAAESQTSCASICAHMEVPYESKAPDLQPFAPQHYPTIGLIAPVTERRSNLLRVWVPDRSSSYLLVRVLRI